MAAGRYRKAGLKNNNHDKVPAGTSSDEGERLKGMRFIGGTAVKDCPWGEWGRGLKTRY